MANRTVTTAHLSGAHPRFPVKVGGFAPSAAARPATGHTNSFDAAMAAQRARVPRLASLHPHPSATATTLRKQVTRR